MMLLYGVEKMEEQLAVVAASWTTASASGDFAVRRHSEHPLQRDALRQRRPAVESRIN